MSSSTSSRRLLIILSLLLVPLLGLVLLTGGKEDAAAAGPAPLFPSEEIGGIRIVLPSERGYRLERRGEFWFLTEPLESRADGDTVQALVTLAGNLVGIPLDHESSLSAEELAGYGIGTGDEYRLILQYERGERREIVFGDVIPLDVGYVYAYDPALDSLYKVQREAKAFLDRSLFEMREKRILNLSPETVTGLSIDDTGTSRSEGGILRLARKDGWWEILEPVETPADSRAVEELLLALGSLQAEEFPRGEPAGPADLRIVLETAEGESRSIEVGPDLAGGLRSVRSDGDASVFGVERARLEDLPVTFEELRSKGLLRFRPEEIIAVSFETPDSAFAVVLRNGDWQFADGRDTRADGALIDRVLRGLLAIRVDDSTDLRAEEIREKSGYRIVLMERGGGEHRLWLSPAGPGDAGPSGVSTFREVPFRLDPAILEAVPLSRDYFEDRRLFSFDPRSVGILELESDTERIRIEKRGSDWMLTRPRRIAADNPAVWRLIFALENLEFLRRADPSGEMPSALEENALLRLRDANEEEIAGLRLYLHRETGEWYARIMRQEGLFVLDSAFAAELPDGAEDLRYSR